MARSKSDTEDLAAAFAAGDIDLTELNARAAAIGAAATVADEPAESGKLTAVTTSH